MAARGHLGRSQAVAVTPDPSGVIGPYADVGPMDGHAPPPPVSFFPDVPRYLPWGEGTYDIRDVPICIGFDFRKRQIVGV